VARGVPAEVGAIKAAARLCKRLLGLRPRAYWRATRDAKSAAFAAVVLRLIMSISSAVHINRNRIGEYAVHRCGAGAVRP